MQSITILTHFGIKFASELPIFIIAAIAKFSCILWNWKKHKTEKKMKSTQLFIALFWIFTAFNVFAQQEIGTMRNYIAKGDAESLSEFFNESVEISIPGSSDIYAQAQAKMIIKNFFSNNQPS